MNFIPPVCNEDAAEHFLEAFAKVLRHQSIHNGVDARVGVGHTMREEPEGICGLIEGEISIEIAQYHYMVWQPANAKKYSDNDDHFGDFALGPFRL